MTSFKGRFYMQGSEFIILRRVLDLKAATLAVMASIQQEFSEKSDIKKEKKQNF